jgi:hypothetical protein
VTFQTAAKNNPLRGIASLLIRCLDCDGAPLIANVAWVNGFPIIAAKGAGERMPPNGRRIRSCWIYSYADRGTVLHARIGTQPHEIPLEDVRAQLPPPGAPMAEMKVRHTPPT